MLPALWRAIVLVSAALSVFGAVSVDAAEAFYQGKTIRIIVGFSPGVASTLIRGPSDARWENICPGIQTSLWKI